MQEIGSIIMVREAFYVLKRRYPDIPHMSDVYHHCVYQASYNEESMGIFDTTYGDIAVFFGLTPRQVRHAIFRLHQMGMLDVKSRSVGGETIGIRVQILDYESLHRRFSPMSDPVSDWQREARVVTPRSYEGGKNG